MTRFIEPLCSGRGDVLRKGSSLETCQSLETVGCRDEEYSKVYCILSVADGNVS
jgi:hypothetical protein